MLNCDPLPLSYSPSARKFWRCCPISPHVPARCFSTRWNGNASWPAGTGVCVVNTVERRTSSSASSNDRPCSIISRMRCRATNAAWPSLRCHTVGAMPMRAQRAHAADAENDFLLDARFAIAAVEPRRQLAIPRRVFREVGVEQEQPHAPEPHAPHRGEHGAIAKRHRGDAGPSVRRDRRLDRRVGPADVLVAFFLPAVVGHALAEVALRIHEADADERQAEVGGFLAVIAGQHAEAARVDRQRLVQRELRGEIRDAAAAEHRRALAPPRMRHRPRLVEAEDGLVVGLQKFGIGGGVGETLRRDLLQHPHRVVGGRPPQRVIEPAKHLPRAIVPAPPQIERELMKTMQAMREAEPR